MAMFLSDDVPDAVRGVITEHMHVWRPTASDLDGEELAPEHAAMFDRADGGLCMTCGRPVGEHATAVVNDKGWALLYCGQACWQDMIVTNYLSDQYEVIYAGIKDRGDDRD
jgi:hypothetical protein